MNYPQGPQPGQQPYGPAQGYPPQAPPPQGYQQPYPQQQFAGPQPQPGGGSFIHIHTSFMPLGFFLYFTGPLIAIDGAERGRKWGEAVFEVAPGVHHLHIHTRYMGTLGPIDQPVQVYPGQHVGVSYEAPMWLGGKATFRFR